MTGGGSTTFIPWGYTTDVPVAAYEVQQAVRTRPKIRTIRGILGCSFFYWYNRRTLNYFNYFTEVEDTFIRRRGKHLFLSPLDWALIEAWQDRGIPMHVVIRSIESVFDVFDQQPAGTRTIKSLFYCREEVESQFLEWQRTQVGGHDVAEAATAGEFNLEAIRSHIDASIAKLSAVEIETILEDVSRAIARLEQLKADLSDDPETIDATLSDVEKLLERAMLTNWDAAHLKYIESQVTAELKQYKREMEADAYRSTFDLMLMRRLREEAAIPRLGLYYL